MTVEMIAKVVERWGECHSIIDEVAYGRGDADLTLSVNNRQFRPRSSSHATSFTIPPSISSNMWPATEKDATRRPRILPPLYSRTALPLVIGRGP
ncbi:hypothetical protein GW17_00058724, partial [Ensete ventricosum]